MNRLKFNSLLKRVVGAPAEDDGALRVSVWRGDRRGGSEAHYAVPARENQTVLDVVTWIQRHAEPGLSYRFACRVGMCGSCAMMVNGAPRWTCRTQVRDVATARRLRLAPLANLPVVKDLVCEMSGFFRKWGEAEGRFQGVGGEGDAVADTASATATAAADGEIAARAVIDEAIECIHCAACYAACDVVAWNPDYLGPAALNRAWTLLNDTRDGAQQRRLAAVSAAGGCQNCHSQQGCARYCPVGLSPARSIAGLKRMVAASAWRAPAAPGR